MPTRTGVSYMKTSLAPNVGNGILNQSFCAVLLLSTFAFGVKAEEDGDEDEEHEPGDAVLYPFFILILGAVVYLLLSRSVPWIPYTAMMFIVGTIAGVCVRNADYEDPSLLHISIVDYWLPINSEVLLLTFLPGLVYSDAFDQDIHLFLGAFWQIFIFAFPMVLAGTVLTALVAYNIFPYEWSFQLCMAFGAILSATDPVAVAALLDKVGAPARIKVHISGESLLNDGSAMVFFLIFSELFYQELEVLGLGKDFDFSEGIKLFFRMAVGGACVGLFFGLGLIGILHYLHRRLSREENVTQVGATVAAAWLCYFVADAAWGTSGVIATLVLGLMVKAFGRAVVNDNKLSEDFWSLVDWLLNTVLFTLGGLVWGSIIANSDPEFPEREFTGRDWGYLVVLYLFLTIIRFALFIICFPVTKKMGLGSSWEEMIFQSYSGLRGAVGISLAIAIDNVVKSHADQVDQKFVLQTNKLFGFVGGIAFLSLIINGVTAGPVLKMLGLSDTGEIRERMLEAYQQRLREQVVDELVRILTQQRFRHVNFAVVKHHVPALKDLSIEELLAAAKRYHESNSHLPGYRAPNLEAILPYFYTTAEEQNLLEVLSDNERSGISGHPNQINMLKMQSGKESQANLTLTELRRVFLELVRAQYEHQIQQGELAGRELVAFSLNLSLDIAADKVSKGEPLKDWDIANAVQIGAPPPFEAVTERLSKCAPRRFDAEQGKTRLKVERALAFVEAHRNAQGILEREFRKKDDFGKAEMQVITESERQVEKAMECFQSCSAREVELIMSHKVSTILLSFVVNSIEYLCETGLLQEQEATQFLEDTQSLLDSIDSCPLDDHAEGEYKPPEKFNHSLFARAFAKPGAGDESNKAIYDEIGDSLFNNSIPA